MTAIQKIIIASAWVLSSCSGIDTKDSAVNLNSTSDHLLLISIQPFDDISTKQVEYIETELKKFYPLIKVNKPIPLPKSSFYSKRLRYRADSLIDFLKRNTPDGQVTIGLTTKDISHTKGDIEDYGIMGLGYKPGRSCVVSTYRLSKTNLLEQFFKLSVHELGHTQGLPHCPSKTCYMRDAEGKNHKDEEVDFCSKCKSVLIAKGWTF